MQDGVYRVWFKGPDGTAAGIMAFRNGDILGCDGGYSFVGRYTVKLGRITGEAVCTRLDPHLPNAALPDLDRFRLVIEGSPGKGFATLRGTVLDSPSYYVSCEFARVCDA
jgi:hypothetical protein